MAKQLARRRRRDRIAGGLVVALGVVVLWVAVIALREPNGHVASTAGGRGASNVAKHSPSGPTVSAAPTRSTPTTSDPAPAPNVKQTPLVVLNNTTTKGLAAQAAHRFEAGGWTVRTVGNLTNDILSTCAYFDPAQNGARAAAKALQAQYPTIKRVEPKFAELPAGPVVVVLTSDYASA